MQVIGRSAGRSATAAAAYRSGEQVADERTGRTHDYTGKSDIYGSEILLPEGAPERLGDRVTLWNEVERCEKRKDAQLSREVMIALPAELSHDQKEALAHEYVQAEFVSQGMIADIGYHDFESHNPHAHIMLTMRSVDEDGFGKKRREWNKRQAIERHRQAWEEYANRALERAGFEATIDHRSLKEQGSDREPQIHLGAKVLEMEARGVQTRVGDESRRISKVNRDIERKAARREKLQVYIAAEQGQAEAYILPDFFYSDESESEVKQAEFSQPAELFPKPAERPTAKSSVPAVDPDIVRRFGELLVRRREEIALESSPAADEVAAEIEKIVAMIDSLSATTEGVFETVDRLLAQSDKAAPWAEVKWRQSEREEGRSLAPPDAKKQEPVQRQEQSKRRQKQRAKKRDQGMEL